MSEPPRLGLSHDGFPLPAACAPACPLVIGAGRTQSCSRRRSLMCRAEVSDKLHRHLAQGQLRAAGLFALAFHPVLDLQTRAIAGYRVQPRFPPGGQTAAFWAEVARRYGLLPDLEMAVIHAALQEAWCVPGQAFLRIDISRATLFDPRMARIIGAGGDRLMLRLVDGLDPAQPRLPAALAAAGIGLSVDIRDPLLRHDGTPPPAQRHLSLAALHEIGPNGISQAYLCAIATGLENAAISRLVAEGIDTPAQQALLAGLPITYADGALMGEPLLCYPR